MKRVLIILFLGIILLCSFSFASAIQGVCTGTQTCFCSGKAVDCPCNADPCVICGPTSPECTGGQIVNLNNAQQTQTSVNTQNPQTLQDYSAVFANGFNNLFRAVEGKPEVIGGKESTKLPTTAERLAAAAALAAMLAALTLIIKGLLKKLLLSNRARPVYPRNIPKREIIKTGCFTTKRK